MKIKVSGGYSWDWPYVWVPSSSSAMSLVVKWMFALGPFRLFRFR